ncbi:MAG TPA: trypsin-like peptidase domain-containing protein [Anaerolineaceae bacterium]|nr:trypsin-like peptidase domain-containing protein [Anaerolineaceae bacterium]
MNRSKWIITLVLAGSLLVTACSDIPMGLSTLQNRLASTAPVVQGATPIAAPAQSNSINQPAVVNSSDVLISLQNTLESIYEKVGPSVVSIAVESTQSSQNTPFRFFGPNGNQNQQQAPVVRGEGSGFVWDKAGHIVTNNHVVEGATNVRVTFSDGFSVPAKVVGTDLNSDLAVIQVSASQDRLQPVQVSDSNQVKVGQLAVAIGNPFGEEGTQTVGFVSAVGRSLPVNSSTTANGASYTIPDVIQTDAPINPGNSGGVLVNDLGQVIGVTAAIESSSGASAGIGFAIPSSIVIKVVPALIQNGSYTYSWLGISGTSLTSELATAMGLNAGQRGVLVGEVTQGSPAEKAGIKSSSQSATVSGQTVQIGGDVIIAIDGKPVNVFEDLVSYLARSTQVGQKVQLTLLRGEKQTTVEVTLEARPAENTQQALQIPNNNGNNNNNQAQQTAWLGISGATLTPVIAQAMNLSQNQEGVLVEKVQPGSPAEKAGLQAGSQQQQLNGQTVTLGGDVITAFDGTVINSIQALQAAIRQSRPGQSVTLDVLRNGDRTQVKVTLDTRPSTTQ